MLASEFSCELQFHLENAKARASQRLREDREKPIDLLARDILLGDTFPCGLDPPYAMFAAMPLSEVRDIREEILEYQVKPSSTLIADPLTRSLSTTLRMK